MNRGRPKAHLVMTDDERAQRVCRIAGLYDDMRPGPPRSIDGERMARAMVAAPSYLARYRKGSIAGTREMVVRPTYLVIYMEDSRAVTMPASMSAH